MKIYDYNGRKNLCGDRVREARARLNITQADLAARLQVAGVIMERDSVSRIEIGTRFVTDYERNVILPVSKKQESALALRRGGFRIRRVYHGTLL